MQKKKQRKIALEAATRQAIETPLATLRLALKTFDLLEKMAVRGNPNSISDVGVGALCARAAVVGAFLNVKINTAGFSDAAYVEAVLSEGKKAVEEATRRERNILKKVEIIIEKG